MLLMLGILERSYGNTKFLFSDFCSRCGKGIRLSRDHKPSDPDERQRIVEHGGFVGGQNRVNGVLAVSRALGDHTFKPYVTPEPFVKTESLGEHDSFVIIACDGVCYLFFSHMESFGTYVPIKKLLNM